MADQSFLDWPFFENRHRDWAELVEQVAATLDVNHVDTDKACRTLVQHLGEAGILQPTAAIDGPLDVRGLCLAREILARHDGLADFAFAMQGLGTGAISLFGSDDQKAAWLPKTRAGLAISAFALTEPGSGSDVANNTMTATRDGTHFVLNGEKTWISNGGIADVYTVFARTGEVTGAKGMSAFIVTPEMTGFEVVERLKTIAPHPLATLRFNDVRVPAGDMIGAPGQGFKIAMSVLDVFRSTVAAAALGFARRALDETLAHVASRKVQGAPLIDLQMVQGHIADMALDIDASALLIYRAAWTKDSGAPRITREAAMAKLFSTERAQQVIDTAVQLHGGDGVKSVVVGKAIHVQIGLVVFDDLSGVGHDGRYQAMTTGIDPEGKGLISNGEEAGGEGEEENEE